MSIIQHKRGIADNWSAQNPTLAAGELGYESDTGKFKIGDGSSAWTSLAYFSTGSGSGSGGTTTNPLTIGTSGLTMTTGSSPWNGSAAATIDIDTTKIPRLTNDNTFTGTQTVTPAAISNKGIVLQALASQSENLLSAMNSSAVETFRVRAGGQFGIGTLITATGIGVNLDGLGASTKGVVIRGAASQTANLQEWQDSTGTMKSAVLSNGDWFVPSLYNVYAGIGTGYSDYQGSATSLYVRPTAASLRGIVVKGLSSQTGNLQEWQDSAGTILAQVTSGGNIISNNQIRATESGIFGDVNQITNTRLSVYTRGVSNKGIVIKGTESQTANLQEWQDSTGTVVAEIDASGNLAANNFIPTYIQSTAPTSTPSKYVWWDTTGGDLTLWIEDGT